MNRRNLLATLTLGAGSALIGKRPARAAVTPPRRIIIFPIANGVVDYPDIVAPGATSNDFTFGRMTDPLGAAGLKDETVIIDNLEFKIPITNIDYHHAGIVEMLTATFPPFDSKSNLAKGPSLDQYLGQKFRALTTIPQLNMGCMCDAVTYSYDATGARVPSTIDPLSIYTRVFGAITNAPAASVTRGLARRQSILDVVAEDVSSFQRRLGAEDARRAEAQLTIIREMEMKLALGSASASSCRPPALRTGIDFKSALYVPETMRAFIDLAVAAMACDQTRVVLMHSYLREYHPPAYKCPWAPANQPGHDFHGLSHDTPGDKFASFVRAKAFFFQLAAELAVKLKAVPELGRTMLDHTIIFIPTEIGRGHTSAGLQFLTIGGAGLGVRTGQYLYVGGMRARGQGVAHNRLLVSLVNALGLPDTTFGEDSGVGPLPGFLV